MSKEIRPIKRSRQLAPWSRDHHEGLLLVWKIRQGLKNGTDPNLIADYIKWFWANHLEQHFREEEELLGAEMQGNEMISRMMDEHTMIRAMVNDSHLATEPMLTKFALLLNDHIRFEERELFGFAEKSITLEQLEKIGTQIQNKERECERWENEFWLRK